jgi:hypothetical protein
MILFPIAWILLTLGIAIAVGILAGAIYFIFMGE